MDVTLAAAITYAVVCAYLHARGVEPRRILRIARDGLLGGLLLSLTVGVVYFLIVLQRPAQTFAVFAIAALLLSAARTARAEILGTITPLGIVLLNIAANFAPWGGPLPLSFAPVAQLIPLPPGALRTLLNLLVLYSPALLALWLQWRGPPGSAAARFILGAWACWIGIASIAGPGLSIVADFRAAEPSRWLAAGFAAFAALHLVMLALNLAGSVVEDEGDSATSIARSVRVDRLPLAALLGIAAAFWLAAYFFLRLTIALDFALTSTALIAAAFGLGSLLARLAPASSAQLPAGTGSLAGAGAFALLALVLAGLGIALWHSASPEGDRGRPVVAATGTAYDPKPQPGLVLRFEEADLHAELKGELGKLGVPFTPRRMGGKEYLDVEALHADAAKKAIEVIEGPPLGRSNVIFKDPARERAFTEWLDRHGVGWRKIRKRRDLVLTWDDGPNHDWLGRAFDDERQARAAGIDYHALYVALKRPSPLELDGIAAFVSPEHQQRFVAWLESQGVQPKPPARGAARFVEWHPVRPKMLEDYKRLAYSQCFLAERERRKGGPVPDGIC